MSTLHPALFELVQSSKAHGGLCRILSSAFAQAHGLSLTGAHAQLTSECDACYGGARTAGEHRLPQTTYVGIDKHGQPWAIKVDNP